jgi:glycosyltransferase involved in cell wall biosynthesis
MIRVTMIGPTLKQNGGIATLENLLLTYQPSGFQVQHITSHDEGSVIYRLLVFCWSLTVLFKNLLFYRPNLIHLHLSERASVYRKIIYTMIAKQFRIPVLIHANGAEFDTFFEGLSPQYQRWVSSGLRQCHSLIAVTKVWQQYYINQVGLDCNQVLVLPNPAKLPTSVPNRENALVVKLVFLGRVGSRKGAFDLIQAFASLPPEARNKSTLIMAGDGDLQKAQQLIDELNLAEHVKLLGWIGPAQRDTLLENANVFILPSYSEGLPLAMIEAMGWELPVISTPVSGIPEVIASGYNGLLVEPGNVQQLAQSMQTLIENEPIRLSMGRAARQTVKPFDIEPFCNRIAETYNSVLDQS